MWIDANGEFTALVTDEQIDVPVGSSAAALIRLLNDGDWSDFFEVMPRREAQLFLVRRRVRYHSTTERVFVDAVWALLRLYSTASFYPPFDVERIEQFFATLLDDGASHSLEPALRARTNEAQRRR